MNNLSKIYRSFLEIYRIRRIVKQSLSVFLPTPPAMTNPSLCYHHFAGIYHRFRSAAFSDYLPMFYGYLPIARCGTQEKGAV